MAELQVHRRRGDVVPGDVAAGDRQAIDSPYGDGDRRICLDIDLEGRGGQAAGRQGRRADRTGDRRHPEPGDGGQDADAEDEHEEAAFHRASPYPSRASAARAVAASSYAAGPSGPMIDCSWPLPASRTRSPG